MTNFRPSCSNGGNTLWLVKPDIFRRSDHNDIDRRAGHLCHSDNVLLRSVRKGGVGEDDLGFTLRYELVCVFVGPDAVGLNG